MNRPRDSVLNLFDPLNTPPRRDVPSPDSGSDKENSSPSESNTITMTAFFGRTYTRQKHVSPVVLRKRLVDVGDVTVADASESLARVVDEDEDGEDGFDSEGNESLLDESLDGDEDEDGDLTILGPWKAPRSDEDLTRSPTSPRLPLREIILDVTPTANKGISKHPDTLSKITSAQPVSRVPADSPFAAVINSINFPSENGSPTAVPTVVCTVEEPAEADAQALGSSTAGLIPSPERALIAKTLSPPSPILSSSALPPEISTVHLRPPRNVTTNSLDPRRTSVDLHTSFNLHLQCPETSFDLLNDRISFFGQETFLNGIDDDDDFDLKAEEAMMEALAHKVEEKAKISVAEDTAPCSQLESKVDEISTTSQSPQANISPVLIHTPQLHKNVSTKSSEKTSSPTILSKPAFSRIPSPPPPSLPSPPKPTERAVPIKADFLPETPEYPTARSMKTALAPGIPPVPSAPVPALRIIKRTKLHERKMSTTTTAPASITPAPISRRRSSIVPAPPPAPVPRHRPMLQGVRRPPPGFLVPATKPALSLPSQKKFAAASSLGKETGVVLQRSAAVAAMPSSKSMPVVAEKTTAAFVSGSSKIAGSTSRLPVVGTKIATGAGGVSALRQPTRYGSGGVDSGSAGTSAGFLPRPASSLSRLPGSRLKAPSVGTVFGNGTVGRAATGRRV